ncbi:hypothetical protein ACHWQZ_G005253 [Mnemiopsis leidyi]
MKESLIPEAGDYNTEPSCAFQSNESNRLSLRRFMRTVLLVRKKKSLFTAYICNSLLMFGFIYYFAFLFTPESEK